MILGFKIAYAFIVTCAVVCGFYRSCKLEENRGVPLNVNGRIYIWLSPLVFPFTIVIIPLGEMLMSYCGGNQKCNPILFIVNTFLFLSIFYVFLLLAMPLFRRFFSAKACAVLWLTPVFVYYLSGTRLDSNMIPKILIPVGRVPAGEVVIVWVVVMVLILLYQMGSHLLFRRKVLQHATEVTDETIVALWEKERAKLNLELTIPLKYCDCIQTPLSMGLFKETLVTLIPRRAYSQEELRLLFGHELHHIQRSDVETKIFLGFCKAFCWFNPLVWIAVKKASEDLELSCDEIVLMEASDEEREHYAELLLKTAGEGKGYTTCLSASASALRYRLKKVVHPTKHYKGICLLGILLFFCCMADGMVSFSGETTTLGQVTLLNQKPQKINTAELYLTEGGERKSQNLLQNSQAGEQSVKTLQEIEIRRIYSPFQYEDEVGVPILYIGLCDGRELTVTDTVIVITQYEEQKDGTTKIVDEKYYAVCSNEQKKKEFWEMLQR